MLNSHSGLCIPPECGFALWWKKKYRDWTWQPQSVSALVDDIASSRKFEQWGLHSENIIQSLAEKKPNDYTSVVELVYECYATSRRKGRALIGDKNNWYITQIAEIRDIFPESKIILLTRDGRDVACSYMAINAKNLSTKYAPILPKDVEGIAKEWTHNNEAAIEYLEDTRWRNAILVRYEDILSSPESELTSISKFLQIEFEEKMLEYYKDNSEPEEMLQWKGKILQKLDAGNTGQYKELLSAQDLCKFENIAGGLLRLLKYE